MLYAYIKARRVFSYDERRFLRYSTHSYEKNKMGAISLIIMNYHVIEKGLTMPNMRLGFGRKRLLDLIKLCNEFIDKYGAEDPQLKSSISIIAEYKKIHKDANYELDEECLNKIDSLLKRAPCEPSQQIDMTRQEYFSDINAPFDLFSASRHSVRNFEGEVSIEQLRNAISLANNAPSACNRQYVRVHCISDKKTINECLALQNGSRGFGHLADKLLIITTDLRGIWEFEHNDLYTNAGIYIMNLCYALHKNMVAHCILSWSVPPSTDIALRKLLKSSNVELNDAESVAAFIVLGGVPKCFKLARSMRRSVDETLVVH